MKRLWLLPILALIAVNLLLAATGKHILIRERHGQVWLLDGGVIVSLKTNVSRQANKRRINMTYCTYWTGVSTHTSLTPSITGNPACPWTKP